MCVPIAKFARRDAAPPDKRPFSALHALQDFVPADQAAKIPILLDIKKRVLQARKRGLIPDDQWKEIEGALPPDDLQPFDINDLPVGTAIRELVFNDGGYVIGGNRLDLVNGSTGVRWRSVYTPDVIAVGEGPESFTDYFSQQARWSRGTDQLALRRADLDRLHRLAQRLLHDGDGLARFLDFVHVLDSAEVR